MGPREPTHQALSFPELWPLGQVLAEAGPRLTPAQVDEVAEAEGVPRARAWMALSVAPMVQVERSAPVAVAVCGSRCQLWGAAALVGELLALRDERLAAGRMGFDLVVKGCLNRCEQAPVVTAALDDGVVGFDRCTRADVVELLDAVEADRGG